VKEIVQFGTVNTNTTKIKFFQLGPGGYAYALLKGPQEFNKINQASAVQIKKLLSRLSTQEILKIIQHMEKVKEIFNRTSR
jgi:hypothetical protein